jgi:hypothetical protein
MTRFRNFMVRLVLSASTPRGVKIVVLTMIGCLIATIALSAIEQVTGCAGAVHDPCGFGLCGPSADRRCPLALV